MPNELKPCECGGKAVVWRTPARTYIQCEKYTRKSHEVIFSGETDEEAVAAWNRRAND
jgi:hypothetical protein